MQSGIGDLSDSIKAANIGAAMSIRHHATASIMRCWHHRNRFASNVDTQIQAELVNRWKVLFQEVGRLVRNIQKNTVQAAFFHFKINGARDNIARCKLGTRIML